MTFAIEILKDLNGARFYTIFEHGRFHQPTMVIGETEARYISNYILAGQHELMYVPDNETIASAVLGHRKRIKLSQGEAADEIGISRTYLILIESGKANISLDVYRAIVEWMSKG